jgi:nitroreductase
VPPEFFDVVTRQRACRAFTDVPVDDELLAQLLTAATHAPSAENCQPWAFIVVRDATRRAAIGDLGRAAWEGGGRAYSERRLSKAMLADVAQGATGGVASAPVLVVVCGDEQRAHAATLPASIWPAVQNLLLAASAVGLGSALTTLSTLDAPALRSLLELPEHLLPMAVVPLGWPARRLGPPRRAPLAERVHREAYGRAW